jgi:CSLREA domain-containing protein
MKPRSFNLLVILALFLSLLGSAVTVTPARATSFTVNTTNDAIDANPGNSICADATGNCSLRAAIQEANALAGADTIILPDGLYTLTLGSTLPTVTTTMTINGSEASSTIIEASTCDPVTLPDNCTPANYRVLNVSDTGNLTIDNVTIRHGQCPDQCIPPIGGGEGGGGIKSFGSLTVTNSLITNNSSPNTGGGIYGRGTTQILNSTFTNNKAGWVGGGLDIASDTARATIIGSTFLNNFAKAGGGGIEFSQGVSSVLNSTFSNNRVELYSGGGINNYESTLTVTNSTFSENRAPNGGGISDNLFGTLFLINNVIANSLVPDGSGITTDCYRDPSDIIGSNINNLIENSLNCGISLSNSDPILGPLGNYGGPTQTMALLNNSPAIDAGTTTGCPATDQRGVTRPQGAACDIGAYEFNTFTNTFTSQAVQDGRLLESSEASNAGGWFDSSATTFIVGDDNVDRQYRSILHFDTSSLPDNAFITKAVLAIRRQGITGSDPFLSLGLLQVDMRKPGFGAPSLELLDFNSPSAKTNAGFFSSSLSTFWHRAILNNPAKRHINLLGTTQFRLSFTLDDNDNNSADFIRFYSGDSHTGSSPAASRPKLIITYTLP